jgi:hypothetical protein
MIMPAVRGLRPPPMLFLTADAMLRHDSRTPPLADPDVAVLQLLDDARRAVVFPALFVRLDDLIGQLFILPFSSARRSRLPPIVTAA